MTGRSRGGPVVAGDGDVTVRYWAAARAAAGVDSDTVRAGTLEAVVDQVLTLHGVTGRFADVIESCSILVGEVPVGARAHRDIVVPVGKSVEFLPPFAGG